MKRNSDENTPIDVEQWSAPSLPLPLAEEDINSEGMIIKFRGMSYGRVEAVVLEDEREYDRVLGENFRDAYDRVRFIYPQAVWINERGEENE